MAHITWHDVLSDVSIVATSVSIILLSVCSIWILILICMRKDYQPIKVKNWRLMLMSSLAAFIYILATLVVKLMKNVEHVIF